MGVPPSLAANHSRAAIRGGVLRSFAVGNSQTSTRNPMRIERLEPRIAPSTASFTFVDVDGDKVEIKINSDSLITPQAIQNVATLRETAPGSGRFQLESLDLTDSKFSGAKVDIDIDRTVPFDQRPGDSRVNVGYINATGRDLTSVSVNGDLGRIDAGNGARRRAASARLLYSPSESSVSRPRAPEGISRAPSRMG